MFIVMHSILQSWFTEKGFQKTENFEHHVVLFLFMLDHILIVNRKISRK